MSVAPPKPPEPQNRVVRDSSSMAIVLVLLVILAVVIGVASALDARQPHASRRNPAHDVILACLQKEGIPVYAVGPDGPPPLGKPVTSEMFTVICVDEK